MGNGFSRVVWYYHTCFFLFPLFFFFFHFMPREEYGFMSGERAWEVDGLQTRSTIGFDEMFEREGIARLRD